MRALRRGDRGREVEDLQTRLLALGFDLGNRGMDRVFGPLTELAVKTFQQEMGILADGVVGELTWNEIVEADYRPGGRLIYVRQPPFRGADVTELQRMLNDLGFDPGAVNGLFDERTARATKEFQRNAGLTEDGAVDDGVFKVLRTYAAQTLGTHQFPDKNGGYFPEDLFSGTIVVDPAHHLTQGAEGTASFYFSRLGYQSHRGCMVAAYVQKGVSQVLGTLDIGEFGRSYDI